MGKRTAQRSAARRTGHPVHDEVLRLQAAAGNRAVTQAVKASKPPTGSTGFQDCPADWKAEAKAAATLSKQWLPPVITGLYNLPQPVPYPIRSYISLYFSTTQRSDLQHIAFNLAQVLGGLTGNIYFQCEHAGGMCSSASAYMYVFGRDIHLCPSWFHNQDGPEKAATVIHELAHLQFGADDIAYDGDESFHKLPPGKAMNNADTYSEFVQETHGMF